MRFFSGTNPKQQTPNYMSKRQAAMIVNNFLLTAVSFHIILSTWIDHTSVPFEYFYVLTGCLMINLLETLIPVRFSK